MPEKTPRYEINEVAELTGLSTARLRAWERRYEVVRPVRLPNGYRVYTAQQVALLRALGRLVDAGHRIGDLVELPRAQVIEAAEARYSSETPLGPLLEAAQQLDRPRLESAIGQELTRRGLPGFVSDIMLPLAEAVGDSWALGRLSVAAEHLMSEVVLHATKGGLRRRPAGRPVLLAGCLPGERHEWGLVGSLALAQDLGWDVQYLGPDLPFEQVVQAAWTVRPAAVALSGADPAMAGRVLGDLVGLPDRLPPRTFMTVGGRGWKAHHEALSRSGVRLELAGLGAPRQMHQLR